LKRIEIENQTRKIEKRKRIKKDSKYERTNERSRDQSFRLDVSLKTQEIDV